MVLSEQPPAELRKARGRIEHLAVNGKAAETKRLGFAAWIVADGSADDAYLAATQSKDRLRDFLDAVPAIADEKLHGQLYAKVRPLIFELPVNLKAEPGGSASAVRRLE